MHVASVRSVWDYERIPNELRILISTDVLSEGKT